MCIKKSDGSFVSKKIISTSNQYYTATLDVNKSDELVTVFIQVDSLIIRKFSSAGAVTLNKQWYFGGSSGVSFMGFDASQSNILLAGTFYNNFSISTATFTTTLGQYWAIRFDNSGAVTWSSQGKSSGTVSSVLNCISEDANGNFYVTGKFTGTGTFTGTTQTLTATPKTGGDAEELFYAKYNSTGNLVWLKQGMSEKSIYGIRIRIGSDNKLYMMGKLGGKSLYLGGDSAIAVSANGSDPYFMAQMDTSGKTLWLKRVNDIGGMRGTMDMHVDGSNNIYFTGGYSFYSGLPLGTFNLPQIAPPGNKFFFAKTSRPDVRHRPQKRGNSCSGSQQAWHPGCGNR